LRLISRTCRSRHGPWRRGASTSRPPRFGSAFGWASQFEGSYRMPSPRSSRASGFTARGIMFKKVISAVIGTRHDRERKKIQPIVDEINEEYARLHDVSEEELRGQTEKLRAIIRERTGELEARVADLRERKKTAADPKIGRASCRER